MIDPEHLTKATTLLTASNRPLLISHPRPDGDTIGPTLALRLALLDLGKQPLIACVHPPAENLAHLPGADAYVKDVPEDTTIDLVVAVDISDLKRTGGIYKDSWCGQVPLLVIDHHETNEAFGDVNIIMPEAAATAIPMRDVIAALGIPIRDDIATCLLVGVLTDTRGLRTDSTTPDVLNLVGELIRAGGDYMGVMQRTLDSVPFRTMRGWGSALNQLQLDGNLAWTVVTVAEKERLGIDDAYDLDLGNLLSRVAEAKIVAAFVEMVDGTVKVSMRARPGYTVAGIAKSMGGGGHRLAAGYTAEGPLDTSVAQALAFLRDMLGTAQPSD